MVIKTLAQSMVKQSQQLLECSAACLTLACTDPALCHPLLSCWPDAIPLYKTAAYPADLSKDERVRALCDLAEQSGRIQTLHDDPSLYQHWGLRSLAAVPLERPAGLLGTLLLADQRSMRFGAGEEHLLYAYFSIRTERLEQALWEQARLLIQYNSPQAEQASTTNGLLKNEIISMVGHELRAPLSVIKGYTGLLQEYGVPQAERSEQMMSPERQRHYLDVIMRQTNLLESLLNDLLDISRLQNGKLTLQLAAIDVRELCQRVIQLGQLRADQQEDKRYELICQVPEHLPPVMADAGRLQQVLFNILENAIKYSPAGGKIELEVSVLNTPGDLRSLSAQPQICFTVRDQGLGIPAQSIQRLFQPFERLEQVEKRHIPGSGLGLYIVRTLVDAMHGQIELRSREGEGTAVTIILPATTGGKSQMLATTKTGRRTSNPIG